VSFLTISQYFIILASIGGSQHNHHFKQPMFETNQYFRSLTNLMWCCLVILETK
jgi:hypothetical protein